MDKHLFKFKWVVTEGDLTEVEQFAEGAIRRIVKDTMHKGIAGNGKVTQNAGLTVTIPNCATVDDIGRISDVTTQAVDMSVDELAVSTNPSAGNTRWVVVAAEYDAVEANPQTDPVGGLPFFFHNLDGFKIRVIAGTETVGTPAVPAVGDAVILGGVILSNGQATITQANLDAGDVSMIASRDMARGALALMDNTQVVEGLPELSTGHNVQDFMNLVAGLLLRKTGDQMEGGLQLVKSDEISTPPIDIRPGHKLNPNIMLQFSELLVNSDLRKGAVVTQTSGTAIDAGALVNAITDEPSGFLRWNDNQNIGTVRIEVDHSASVTAVGADQKYRPAAWLRAKPTFTAALKSIELFVETTVDALQSVSVIDRDIDHAGTWPDNNFILLSDFDVNGPIEQAHYEFTFDASFPVDPGEFFSINQLMLYHANETLVGHLSPSWRALADIGFAERVGFDDSALTITAGEVEVQGAIVALDDAITAILGTDAMDVSYSPAILADWLSGLDPGQVDDALDQLAARLTDEENKQALPVANFDEVVADTSTSGAGFVQLLSVNITPQSALSKFAINFSASCDADVTGDRRIKFQLFAGPVGAESTLRFTHVFSDNINKAGSCALNYLLSAIGAGAHNIQIWWAIEGGGGNARINVVSNNENHHASLLVTEVE